MAFGFGFNKQKVLSAAEKFVQQGKLQNAIAEYEKILKHDPKDLTVMNTIGDLYARNGQSDKALECFKSVGDAYATQGFTVKAIAMYKKLTKLKPSLEAVLRLAELFTQQGLFNDARAQYLQVAEEFLKTGELEQAVRIFQKTLEMDPDNVAMKMRLAEVYVRLGKKTEAWQIFVHAAENLRARGSLGGAEEILQRMLTLDPGNSYALLLRGKNALDSGDLKSAIKNLEKVADLDTHPDGLHTLFSAYVQANRLTEAGAIASKLLTVHNEVDCITRYTDALMGAGQYLEALQVYRQHSDRLLASHTDAVLESLHNLIGHVRDNVTALELLLDLLTKAGDTSHLTEIYELLAHSYVQAGEPEKAREYYLKLSQLEPQNPLHTRNYQQMLGHAGAADGSQLITVEEGASIVDELEATAPVVEQQYPDDVAVAIRAALTDAELFVSYNMSAKALGPLLAALPQAPRDLRLNQRLAALHTRAERFAEAGVCCRTLESIYHDANYPEEAQRYGELAEKYEQRASAGPAVEMPVSELPVEEAPAPTASAAPVVPSGMHAWPTTAPAPAVAASGFKPDEPEHVPMSLTPSMNDAAPSEIDLSSEWEISEPGPAPADAQPAVDEQTVLETVEEIRFYLAHSMVEQAHAAMAKLESYTPHSPQLAALREEIRMAEAVGAAPAADSVELEEVSLEPPAAVQEQAHAQELRDFTAAPQSFTTHTVPPLELPEAELPPMPPPPQPEPAVAQANGVLGEFVADLESSLGDNFMPAAPAPAPAPAPAVSAPGWGAKTKPVFEPPASALSTPAAAIPAPPPPEAAPMPAAAAAAASAGVAPTFTYHPSKMRALADQPPADQVQTSVDLSDMFGELKQELEADVTSTDDDPETHYNLGVAFREMGLLDEAIGELQKVCQAVEHGLPFAQLMQTYTWLAQCFLDKGVPEAAIRWYERALQLPQNDADTRLALHYELAAAYETAQNKPAAIQHFMEVYGSNIDYRDVAERIQALKS